MWYFHNWSAAAFLYLGLHGTYTLLWLIKQSVFADKRFAQPIPLWIGVLIPFLPATTRSVGFCNLARRGPTPGQALLSSSHRESIVTAGHASALDPA
jgi:hypothetical protein